MFTQSHYREFAVYDNHLKGEAVVFLHGLGANATYGEFLTAAFPGKRIILVDLPAHGASNYADADIDVYQIALDLQGLFEAYGIEKPVICGHSLGGQIALLYDITHQHHAASLLLISPAGLESFNTVQKHAILASLQFGTFFHQWLTPRLATTIKVAGGRFPDSAAVGAYVRSMLERPVRDLLGRISCRALVIFGENDALIPNRLFNPDSALTFAHKVLDPHPNFTLRALPDCGHWPMVENPQGLMNLLQGNFHN